METTGGITLRSFTEPFDTGFAESMETLSRTMRLKGLEPDYFAIEKHPSSLQFSTYAHTPLTRSFDYLVTAGDEQFTVTLSNDANFLEYFMKLCAHAENVDGADKPPLYDRIVAWLNGSGV